MKLYEYQRSMSFIDFGPRSFTFSSVISLETARLIEAKFHVSLHGMGNESEYTNGGLCHITKMAAITIYGKNLKKSSSLESKSR